MIKLDPGRIDDYYFPVNVSLAENLLGKLLTHVEAINLPSHVQKANKDLIRQTFWAWWSRVQENSITSAGLCIGPIEVEPGLGGNDRVYRWLTDVGLISRTRDVRF